MSRASVCSVCGVEPVIGPGFEVCEFCAPHQEVIVREKYRPLSAEELEEL